MRVECCIQVLGCKRVNKSRWGMQQHISVQQVELVRVFDLKPREVIVCLCLRLLQVEYLLLLTLVVEREFLLYLGVGTSYSHNDSDYLLLLLITRNKILLFIHQMLLQWQRAH